MALVICTWSGGIDSTALIGQLLKAGHSVHAVSLGIYGGPFGKREQQARELIRERLDGYGDQIRFSEHPADWIWAFSPDGIEIPRRNRYIIDHLIAAYAMPVLGVHDIGLGEYIGADTWLVRDHVGAADADARALASYIYQEYGLDYRLWTLSDFGEARYKHQRLKLGIDAFSLTLMGETTNCLADSPTHCGRCYKCIERAVAFEMLSHRDPTRYQQNPRQHPAFALYRKQMAGEAVVAPAASDLWDPVPMPHAASRK